MSLLRPLKMITNCLLILECLAKMDGPFLGSGWIRLYGSDLIYHNKLDEILTQNQLIVNALTHVSYILIMIFSNFCTVPNIYMIELHKTNIICCG